MGCQKDSEASHITIKLPKLRLEASGSSWKLQLGQLPQFDMTVNLNPAGPQIWQIASISAYSYSKNGPHNLTTSNME